jgi:formylglycine-generating enzyme required for sulfatase activity
MDIGAVINSISSLMIIIGGVVSFLSALLGIIASIEPTMEMVRKLRNKISSWGGFRNGSVKKISPDDSFELEAMTIYLMDPSISYDKFVVRITQGDLLKANRLHKELQKKMVSIFQDQDSPVIRRAKAGDVLSQIGDLRFRPDKWYLPDDETLGFVEIPDGDFFMGCKNKHNTEREICEDPKHTVYLPLFYMARYPVTVAQYNAYLEDTHKKTGQVSGLSNHPVGFISWYEALAYCNWLTKRLRKSSGTPRILLDLLKSSYAVTLPSEAEWEKAARGGVYDYREFPWGPKADSNMANYADTDLNTTSPVGCFEKGLSPYKIYDLSGNTWEWTRSLWGTDKIKPSFFYPYPKGQLERENLQAPENILRVTRGGSFHCPPENIRCSHRGGEDPNEKFNHIGFRLVLSKISNK